MKYDNCEYCGAEVKEKRVRTDYRAGNRLVVIEDVPLGVCVRCGERYYDAKVLKRLEIIANQRKKPKKVISVPVKWYDEAVSL